MLRQGGAVSRSAGARHEVPFENFRLASYLRVPPGIKKPPVVVIISGLESTKEEARTMEDGFLRRGLATFTFDGPGQGESWFQGGMIVEFERATSAVIDYLEKLPAVDAGRVGVFGPSMGGYLAPRSAACDTRIKACAFAGGMYDRTRVLNRLEDPFEFARVAHIWKVYDKQKLVELHSRCTLEGLAPKIRCPLMVVHGTKDFVPVEQAKRTYDEASGPEGMGLARRRQSRLQQHALSLPPADRRFPGEAFGGGAVPTELSCISPNEGSHAFYERFYLCEPLCPSLPRRRQSRFLPNTKPAYRSAPEFAWIPAKDMRE